MAKQSGYWKDSGGDIEAEFDAGGDLVVIRMLSEEPEIDGREVRIYVDEFERLAKAVQRWKQGSAEVSALVEDMKRLERWRG